MFVNIDFFAFGAPFWELWGGSWASLGALWASKTAPKSLPYIETSLFFFNLCCFCGATFVFLRFGRVWGGFWEGLGKIWGWLGMIWGRFGKVFFPMHRLLFLHASSLGFAATKTRKNNKLPEQDVFLLVFVAPIWNDQHSLSKASSATKTSKPKKLQISIRLSFPTPLLPPSWPGGMREAIRRPTGDERAELHRARAFFYRCI